MSDSAKPMPRSGSQPQALYVAPSRPLEIPAVLLGDLRSDHAGETGAVRIYSGILAVCRDERVREFAQHHLSTEREHLSLIEAVLAPRARSRLLPLWHIAGFLTGFLPALFGPRAVFATIRAVETFVDHHYQAQLDKIDALMRAPDGLASGEDLGTLRALIAKCHADEIAHRDDAHERLDGAPLTPWLRAWCAAVGIGSRVAVYFAVRF
ncbi:MAG: demethoxyubiquinone hydroxylase family protein [Pseudomonadota bacterium]